jgi:RND family efflux transporter MFP subunit
MRRNPVLVAMSPVLAGTMAVGCTPRDGSARAAVSDTPKAVRTALVELTSAPEATTYSAIIAPNAQVDVAFRVPGYIVYLEQTRAGDGRVRPLEPGAAIRAGMTLARVRTTEYEASVAKARGARDEAEAAGRAAEADITAAQAALTQAQLDFERIVVLWQQESITKPVYDGSKAKLDAARAKVDAATAAAAATRQRAASAAGQLQEAQIALADTDLRSPLGGILLERRVEVGSFATAGTPAFIVADLRLVKARFSVPDTALQNIRTGQSLPLTIDAFPSERFDGRILSIAPAADPRSRSFEVVVSIVNPEVKLRSGMIAAIQAPGDGDRLRTQVPIDALIHDPVHDRYLVYSTELKDGTTVVRAVPVTPGPLLGNQVVILEGLAAGQHIIVSGANLLRPGDLVSEVP